MKRNIFSAMCMAAVVLLSASCSQDNEAIVPVTNERATFTGIAESIGSGTRAYNEYSYIVKWNQNDQIYVTDNDSHNNTFTLASGKDTPVGTFSEDKMEGGTYAGFISGKTVEAFYPASLKTADGYVWPATQSNNQVAPMYASQSISGTENEVVSFSSLGAMLQIVFSTKTEGITVTSITLQSNKKPLSGLFTVDENGQAIMAENSENPGVTLNLGESGVPVGVAAKYFYLAIPAGTYSTPEKDEVMTITFKDDVHHSECVMTSTTFPTVNRNTVGRITLTKDFQDQKWTEDQEWTVKFDMNGHGYAIADAKVKRGAKVTVPPTPTAENYAFWCWCIDEDCTIPFDFSWGVMSDLTLYAKWTKGINGHAFVALAGYKWATENVGECSVTAVADPKTTKNKWGFYFYKQANEDALNAANSWDSEGGHKWTLPSDDQWNELMDKCYWEWTDSYNYPISPYNGMSGYIVYEASEEDKGKLNITNSGYTPATVNHLFLPAAGYYRDDTREVDVQGAYGYFWSSDCESCLFFNNDFRGIFGNEQYDGMVVRPVSE